MAATTGGRSSGGSDGGWSSRCSAASEASRAAAARRSQQVRHRATGLTVVQAPRSGCACSSSPALLRLGAHRLGKPDGGCDGAIMLGAESLVRSRPPHKARALSAGRYGPAHPQRWRRFLSALRSHPCPWPDSAARSGPSCPFQGNGVMRWVDDHHIGLRHIEQHPTGRDFVPAPPPSLFHMRIAFGALELIHQFLAATCGCGADALTFARDSRARRSRRSRGRQGTEGADHPQQIRQREVRRKQKQSRISGIRPARKIPSTVAISAIFTSPCRIRTARRGRTCS